MVNRILPLILLAGCGAEQPAIGTIPAENMAIIRYQCPEEAFEFVSDDADAPLYCETEVPLWQVAEMLPFEVRD